MPNIPQPSACKSKKREEDKFSWYRRQIQELQGRLEERDKRIEQLESDVNERDEWIRDMEVDIRMRDAELEVRKTELKKERKRRERKRRERKRRERKREMRIKERQAAIVAGVVFKAVYACATVNEPKTWDRLGTMQRLQEKPEQFGCESPEEVDEFAEAVRFPSLKLYLTYLRAYRNIRHNEIFRCAVYFGMPSSTLCVRSS